MNLGKVLNVTNARDGHLPLAHLKEDSTKSLFLRIVFPKEGTALRLAYGGRTSSLPLWTLHERLTALLFGEL